MGIFSGTTTEWLFVHCFRVELKFGNVAFVEGGNPSEKRREPTTNSSHIWRQLRESNPGHTGGRPSLLPKDRAILASGLPPALACSASLQQRIWRNKFCFLYLAIFPVNMV